VRSKHRIELGDATRRITVPAVTLDDLSLGPVDFIKLDVEGGELAVGSNPPRATE
jgi:FkbM family methyltransferase